MAQNSIVGSDVLPGWSPTRNLSTHPTCQQSEGSRIHGTGLARNILTPTIPMVLYVCYMYHYIALLSPEIGSSTNWEVSLNEDCLLYTSDAADDLLCVDLGGRR